MLVSTIPVQQRRGRRNEPPKHRRRPGYGGRDYILRDWVGNQNETYLIDNFGSP
jgi:hypothetical protein